MSTFRHCAFGLAAVLGMTLLAGNAEARSRWGFSFGNSGWNGGYYRGHSNHGYGYGHGHHRGYGNSYHAPYGNSYYGNSYYGRSYGSPYDSRYYHSYPGYYNSGPTFQFRF